MAIFKKKKTQMKELKFDSYKNWQDDFGLLFHIIEREVSYITKFLIEPYSEQLIDDYLNDDDIEPLIRETITSIINSLSNNYKMFLEEKYLNSGSLLDYITKEVFYRLNVAAINSNNKKITKELNKQKIRQIQELNK